MKDYRFYLFKDKSFRKQETGEKTQRDKHASIMS